MSFRFFFLVTLLAFASTAAVAQPCNRQCALSQRDGRGCCPDKCRAGKTRVKGHCCWVGQKWSSNKSTCTGTPTRCPRGLTPMGNRCGKKVVVRTCPTGQTRTEESADNCCWPGQKWDDLRARCGGEPVCPVGYLTRFETCYRKPKKIVEDKFGVSLVQLPGGRFSYGCVEGDEECADAEKENHDYDIDAFWMTDAEVSVNAFSKCIDANVCTVPDSHYPAGWQRKCNWGRETEADHPVNCVDFNQAKDFCTWMGARLPSRIEWEYAAKGGENRIFPWVGAEDDGDDVQLEQKKTETKKVATCREAVFKVNGPGCGTMFTWPIRAKAPGKTQWGVFDLAGNVAEFTRENDRSGVEVRGGSFLSEGKDVRTTSRTLISPTLRTPAVGFRCVRAPDQ